MRLRRETGDFSIVLSEGSATINKNLKAEDFIGIIISNNGAISVVIKAEDNDGVVTLTDVSGSFTYTASTGVIEVVNSDANEEEPAADESDEVTEG